MFIRDNRAVFLVIEVISAYLQLLAPLLAAGLILVVSLSFQG